LLLGFAHALVAGLLMGFVYSLIASGLSLIFGVMNIVNFAHGEFLMLGMFAAYWCSILLGLDPLVSIVIAVPIMFLIGVVVYKLIIRRVLKGNRISQILVTFGLSTFIANLTLLLWSPNYRLAERSLKFAMGNVKLLGIHVGIPEQVCYSRVNLPIS